MTSQIIKTRRLNLRPLTMRDAPELARLIGDYDVSRCLAVVPYPYHLLDAETFIRNCQPAWRFGIEIDDTICGVIDITSQLGYWLGKPYWGNGYMGEAAQAVVGEWFKSDSGTIRSGYFTENTRSGSILRNLGFVPGKVVREYSLAQGKDVDLQKMTLSRDDWRLRNG